MEMDFHGMKRKDLQTLCKKHGIPANLKNTEMATRLASVFEKEDEETIIETKCSLEDGSIEEENLVAIRKAKRVRFSPESENEVFEFTRSVKKLQRKNVKKRSHGTAKDLPQGRNIEVRRSKRISGSNGTESNSISVILEAEKGCSSSDATKAHKIPRRSKRIGSSGIIQEEHEETDLIALERFEDKDIQDGLVFKKVGRRSTRLAAKTTKSFVDGGTLKSGTLLPAKESKEERTMQSCETKTAEPIMISENVLDSTSKVSVDVSLVRNTQELNSEVIEEGGEEKQEQDSVMMTATKNDKEVASSLSELFVETIQPSSSVQLSVSKPESKLDMPTGHVLVKDIAEQNIKTEEVAKAVHSFVAKLAETDVLENSAECWNESLPSKDDERGSLEKEKQSANQHGNFSEYNTENNSAEEQGDICTVDHISGGHCVSRETLDDDSQMNFVPTIFSERVCKPDVLELGGSLSTDFASQENVSESLEEDESLMFMEQLSESGKISAADIVTQHNDKAVESNAVVFTTPGQVLLLGDYGLDEVGKEEEHTATDFPDESDVHNTSQSEANGGESIVVELHEESNVSASPLRQSNVGDFKEDGIKWNEENRTVELHCESSTCTSLNKHALLGSFVSDGAENSGGSRSKTQLNSEFMEEEREEKQEQDTVMVTATKNDKELASSLSELFVETTQPSSSVQLEVSNPESELGVPAGHVLVKDIAEENIETEEVPKSVHSCVTKLAETDAVLENSAEYWNESLPSKDDERGSLEKEKQSANQHGNFSEYITENSSAEEQANICTVGRISAGHCVSRETLDEVNNGSQTKFVPTMFSERGCKQNALELSTDFASLSPKEDNVSECLEEDEMKALSQPSNALDRSFVFTTPGRNLLLMEQLSESGKICAADTVTQHNHEAVESHAVVFTTPEQVLFLGDSGLDEVGKEEEHTATDFPVESDVLSTSQNEAINGGESIVVELHDESDIAASPLRQSSVGDFKGDGIKWTEENRTVELHCESDTCTSPNRHALLGSFVSDGAENSGGSKATEIYEESVVELQVDCGLFTGAEKHLLLETDEGMKGDNRIAKSHDMADILTAFESYSLTGDSEPNEAENKYRENKDVELLNESNISTNLERHLLSGDCGLGEIREIKDSTSASWVESFVFSSPERRHHLGNSEPHTAGKEVEFKDESAFFTRLETHLLLGESGPDRLGNSKSGSSQYQSQHASSSKIILKEDSVVCGSHVSALDLGENTIAGGETPGAEFMPKISQTEKVAGLDATQGTSKQSRGKSPHVESVNLLDFDIEVADTIMDAERTASFSSHVLALPAKGNSETNDEITSPLKVAGTSTLVSEKNISLAPNEFTVQDNINEQDATQGTLKQGTPYVTSVNLFDSDIEEERNVHSHVLALPAESDSEIIGEISSHLEVGGTCSMVSDNNEAESMKNVDSPGGSSFTGMTCFLAGTEDAQLGFTKDDATDPIVTAFEKDISLIPDGTTVPNNINEEDEEMVRREATPSPEETLNESSGHRKEYVNIGGSGTSYEKQVRRESILVYRTQVKPKRHDDMKENAPNSKIVDNLNVTAPRKSRRQPLQDLKKN